MRALNTLSVIVIFPSAHHAFMRDLTGARLYNGFAGVNKLSLFTILDKNDPEDQDVFQAALFASRGAAESALREILPILAKGSPKDVAVVREFWQVGAGS